MWLSWKSVCSFTFNHLFELLEEDLLGHFSPWRAWRSLWAGGTWRTRWAGLGEEGHIKYSNAAYRSEKKVYWIIELNSPWGCFVFKWKCKMVTWPAIKLVYEYFDQKSNTDIQKSLKWETIRDTQCIWCLPEVVCVCDIFQESCQLVFWQSPSMNPVGLLSVCPQPAVETVPEIWCFPMWIMC